MYSLEQLKQMDTIVLTESIRDKISNEFIRIIESGDKSIPLRLILKEGVIKYIGKTTIRFIVFKGYTEVDFECWEYLYIKKSGKLNYVLNCTFDYAEEEKAPNVHYIPEKMKTQREEMELEAMFCKGMVGAVLIYLTHKSLSAKVRIVKSEPVKESERRVNNQQLGLNRKKEIYIGDIKIKTLREKELLHTLKQKRVYYSSWTVRGHYRNLRNGKQVFVSSYIKGDKSKHKGTNYYPVKGDT